MDGNGGKRKDGKWGKEERWEVEVRGRMDGKESLGNNSLCSNHGPLCSNHGPLCSNHDPLCSNYDPLCSKPSVLSTTASTHRQPTSSPASLPSPTQQRRCRC
ncbi:hypothetical protein Pmani_034301 [Petrolisthes manimaculis]|uniref:Uncharacterized protein n=1 Tax=Petrolisthes manimaculis TaxID=1843537 RepID=A0AAE1NMS3_9EUCA|nr:hypothetical protein Pmani_034301 [Petrolisthes manimaculis]